MAEVRLLATRLGTGYCPGGIVWLSGCRDSWTAGLGVVRNLKIQLETEASANER